jgi:ribokinase
MNSPIIAVVGSLNVDHTFRVRTLPTPGETVTASGALTCFGGKGANQALAAARAGAKVRMIGCVGEDDAGRGYQDYFRASGIEISGIVATPETSTGSAFITVDDAGENSIVVSPGANHSLSADMINDLADAIRSADMLLLQLECPLPTVRRAAEIAKDAGVCVVLNPSPWNEALLKAPLPSDILIANASEASALAGRKIDSEVVDPRSFNTLTLIVTRGSESTLAFPEDSDQIEISPPQVTPVDTVGAGDTFAGAFAFSHATGASLREAITFANSAAALATLKPGAQSAIPERSEVLNFLAACSAGS